MTWPGNKLRGCVKAFCDSRTKGHPNIPLLCWTCAGSPTERTVQTAADPRHRLPAGQPRLPVWASPQLWPAPACSLHSKPGVRSGTCKTSLLPTLLQPNAEGHVRFARGSWLEVFKGSPALSTGSMLYSESTSSNKHAVPPPVLNMGQTCLANGKAAIGGVGR